VTALLILNYDVTDPRYPAASRRTATPAPLGRVGAELVASTDETVRLSAGGRPAGGTHTVVLRCRDAEHARAVYDSARYRELLEERLNAAAPPSAMIVPELPAALGRGVATGLPSPAAATAATAGETTHAGSAPVRLGMTEFVAQVGLSARSIRAYHARGLLPPAERIGKRVFYGPEHIDRVTAIQRLQRRGLNLEAILAISGEDLTATLPTFREALAAGPATPATPATARAELADLTADPTVEPGSLLARLDRDDPSVSRVLGEHGILGRVRAGEIALLRLRLIRSALALQSFGIPPLTILRTATDVLDQLHGAADDLAKDVGTPCVNVPEADCG
jgi:DNA-binding transcriptional MerR regulator/uncharacterized protein (DUF1330 family)